MSAIVRLIELIYRSKELQEQCSMTQRRPNTMWSMGVMRLSNTRFQSVAARAPIERCFIVWILRILNDIFTKWRTSLVSNYFRHEPMLSFVCVCDCVCVWLLIVVVKRPNLLTAIFVYGVLRHKIYRMHGKKKQEIGCSFFPDKNLC